MVFVFFWFVLVRKNKEELRYLSKRTFFISSDILVEAGTEVASQSCDFFFVLSLEFLCWRMRKEKKKKREKREEKDEKEKIE